VLSIAALSRKLLPRHLHVPDDKPAKPTGYTVGRANREGEQLQTRGSIPLPDPNQRWRSVSRARSSLPEGPIAGWTVVSRPPAIDPQLHVEAPDV
jgi:hypothetical protein